MPIEMKGPLSEKSLDEVFKILRENDIACSLLVSDGVSEKIFYFSIGGIRMVSLGGRKGARLGEILIAQGRLTPDQIEKIDEHAKTGKKRFGDAALELGLLQRHDIDAAVRSQVEGELADLYLWSDAEYEFTEGQPPQQFYDDQYQACSISFDVREFIAGVQERRRRWSINRAKVGSDRDVFKLTEKGKEVQGIGAEDVVSTVLSLVDGKRRVRDLVADSDLNALSVYEALFTLLDDKLIRKASGSRRQQLGREEILEEIRKLESARDRMMGDVIVRTRLAKAYEQINDRAKAAAIWKEISNTYRRKNDLKRALKALQKAVRCLPEDFNMQEQVLEMYRAIGDKERFLRDGSILAEKLFKSNLLNRARQLLSTLTHMAPGDVKIRKLLALTLIGLGQDALALIQLKELAAILEKEGGRKEELKEVYRRILALDKGNRAIRAKLLAVDGHRKGIWISRGVMALAAVMLIVAGIAFVYELSARNAYAGEGLALEKLLAQNDFDGARKKIRDFQHEYGASFVARKMQGHLKLIDQREKQYLTHGLLSDLKLAKEYVREENHDGATRVFKRMRGLDPAGGELSRKAREAADTFFTDEASAADLILLARRKGYEEDDWEEAHKTFMDAWEKFPHTRAVAEAEFPLLLDTQPADARVTIDGKPLQGNGARLAFYSVRRKSRIRVERSGFEPFVLDVEEFLDPLELTVHLKKETRWVFEGDGPFESTPVIQGNTLYIAGRDRNLYAIDVEDGTLKYKISLGIFNDVESNLAVLNGCVVVGAANGDLFGIDEVYGRVKWKKHIGPAIRADLVADEERGIVFVSEAGGRILAVNPETGELFWTANADTGAGNAPYLEGARLFVGSYDEKKLVALMTRTGQEAWSTPLPARASGSPAFIGDQIVLGGTDGKLYAVDSRNPTRIRRHNAGSIIRTRPTVAAGLAYVGSMDGHCYCLQIEDGIVEKWKRRLSTKPILADAAVGGAAVYLGSLDGNLYCLNPRDGVVRWTFETGDRIVAAPLIHEGTIYLPSMDGHIYAIREYE